MDCITKIGLTYRVKKLLGRVKNKDWKKIYVDDALRGKVLRFTTKNLRALAADIRRAKELEEFDLEVEPDETGGLKTVRDLRELIWTKIPEDRKC